MKIQEIVRKYKEGDDSALNDLVLEYNYIISYILRNFSQYNYYEDLKQEMMIHLLRIVENYNIDLDVKFKTYAYKHLQYYVYRVIGEFYPIRIPPHVKYDEYVYDVFSNESASKDYFSEFECAPQIHLDANVKIMREHLSEKEFLACRYYIMGYKKTEIGRILGCSSEYVNQLIKKSAQKLKDKMI